MMMRRKMKMKKMRLGRIRKVFWGVVLENGSR
jgi:hypothetical protein